MEKQLEKIELEYSLYEVEKVLSVDQAIESIYDIFSEADHYKDVFEYIRKNNKKERRASMLLGFFRRFNGGSCIDCEYYDDADAVLDKQERLLNGLYGHIFRIFQEVDDDNFVEMHKLACFTREKYRINDSHYEELRQSIGLRYRGVDFPVANSTDDSDAFSVFFDKKLEDVTYVESVEKVKK